MSRLSQAVQTTVKGAMWNYAVFAISKGSIFFSTIILARVLVPEDFGLLALGLLAINFMDALSGLGVHTAFIQRQDDAERTASVAFVISIGVAGLLTAIAFFGAPKVAVFFDEPRVTPIIRVLALGFLLSGLRRVHESRLRKALDFRRRLIPEMGKSVVKGGLAIVLAYAGYGVWSLIWGHLAGGVTSTVLYWGVSRWRPRLTLDWPIAKALIGYGLQITLAGLLGVLHKNVDYLIIGHRMDTVQLGFYTIAFRLPELVIINICYVVSQTLFPTYAKLQNDLSALRTGFVTTLRYVSLITMPAAVGMSLITPEFVQVCYTTRWAPAIPAMQVLSLYALVYSLSFNVGDIYKAIGRLDILNRLNVVKLLVTVPVLWIAADYGIVALAMGQVLTTVVLTLLRFGIASRVLGIHPRSLLQALTPTALGVLVMGLGILALRLPLSYFGAGVRLCGLILSGVLLYSGTLWWAYPELFQHARSLMRSGGDDTAAPLAVQTGAGQELRGELP